MVSTHNFNALSCHLDTNFNSQNAIRKSNESFKVLEKFLGPAPEKSIIPLLAELIEVNYLHDLKDGRGIGAVLFVLCENKKDDNVSRTGAKVNKVVIRRFLEIWRQFFIDAENGFNQEASY